MDELKFELQLRAKLIKLPLERQVEFARLCALRVLPYLAREGHLDFWPPDIRQQQLYLIFDALDTSAAYAFSTISYSVYSRDVAKVATFTAYIAYATYVKYGYSAANDARTHAANTTDTVFSAIKTSNAAASTSINSAIEASKAIIYGCPSQNDDIAKLLLQDLEDIKSNSLPKKLSFSSEDWENFKTVLKNENCEYWAKLYRSIFDCGIDIEALKQRINIPEEIKAQGAAVVGHYLEKLEREGAERLNESRILILGEKGAGKTCIARRLVNPLSPMTKPEESTAGVDTTTWELDTDNIKARIWDFAGHTVTHAVHQFFLSERCLYILVYDGRSEQRNRLTYWLDHMKNYGGDSQAIILVNKHDNHKIEIPINSLKEKYAIHSVHYFSIKDDLEQLENFRNIVSDIIINNPSWSNQQIPADYYQVKTDLENLFDKNGEGKEHINVDEFNSIADKHNIENANQLLKDLHALGISLWYENLNHCNTLVLNPEWISHGVYKIINYVANQKHSCAISLVNFRSVFINEAERFNEEHHPFLFALIKHYELAYETHEGKKLIIPHLLPRDRPETLPSFAIDESLMLKYVAEAPLPPHTISRFIVRHNQQIQKINDTEQVWLTGVILTSKDTTALVREDDRTISIAVKGPQKTKFISELRNTMEDIFNS